MHTTNPKLAHDHGWLTCQPFKPDLYVLVSRHVHMSFLYSTYQVATASRTECLKRARVGGHDRLARAGQPRRTLVGIPGGQGQAHPMASLAVIKLQLLSRTGSIQQPAASISQHQPRFQHISCLPCIAPPQCLPCTSPALLSRTLTALSPHHPRLLNIVPLT